MKTQNTTIENVQTALMLTFIPLIVTGIISLNLGNNCRGYRYGFTYGIRSTSCRSN